MNSHPNATAAGSTGTAGVLIIAALGALGVTLSPIVAAAIVTAATTVVLIVGRRGLRGIGRLVWNGSGS